MEYTASTIAHWFIKRFKDAELTDMDNAEQLSLMKLLKLLYYAEGSSLALRDESMFKDSILAWEHGPVVSDVYFKYRDNTRNLPLTKEDENDANRIDKETVSILEQVYSIFGQYTASGLRNKTHNETPWVLASNNGQTLNEEITRDSMKEYFKKNYVTA